MSPEHAKALAMLAGSTNANINGYNMSLDNDARRMRINRVNPSQIEAYIRENQPPMRQPMPQQPTQPQFQMSNPPYFPSPYPPQGQMPQQANPQPPPWTQSTMQPAPQPQIDSSSLYSDLLPTSFADMQLYSIAESLKVITSCLSTLLMYRGHPEKPANETKALDSGKNAEAQSSPFDFNSDNWLQDSLPTPVENSGDGANQEE